MALFVVLLGPPGAGKGTQARILSHELGIPHVSSGDIFRENISNQTELGKLADRYIRDGDLVPDDVTNLMIQERLARQDCSGGAVLDGFPRTPDQASALENMLNKLAAQINLVYYITVPEETLIERYSGRWTCRAQGHVYHEKYNPAKDKYYCDLDGSELYQREDDKAETVSRRIRVYFERTQPLIDFYKKKSILVEIDGTPSIEQVTTEMLSALEVVK